MDKEENTTLQTYSDKGEKKKLQWKSNVLAKETLLQRIKMTKLFMILIKKWILPEKAASINSPSTLVF